MIFRKLLFFKAFLVTYLVLYGFCFSQTNHFGFRDNTGDSYSIVVDSIFKDSQVLIPEEEDEIGVFTSKGLCVGASILDQSLPLPMVAWKDDPLTTEIDGYTLSDTMYFRFWNSVEGIEMDAKPLYKLGNGTFGDGFFSQLNLRISGSTVEEFSDEVSYYYILTQNYPNPFNPETKISYVLPKDCDVKLTIYNLLGQKIKILVDEHQTAGYKHVSWDGKDDEGKEVVSGIYFHKLDTGDFTQSKRMVLIR